MTLRPALLALAVLALLVAVLALSPSARLAVADRLGLRGLEIGHVPEAPMPEPRPSATPVGARLDLGDRVTLEEARARAGYRVLLPALQDFGAPEVYFSDQPPGGQVALVYPVRAGLPETRETGVGVLLTQFPGDVEPGFVQKGLGPGARVEAVSIEQGSERWAGYWIEGEAHSLVYLDPTGRPRAETLRLAGRTLVWEQDGVTFRLESALDKDEAIRIAGSLR